MKLLSPKEYKELNEMFILTKSADDNFAKCFNYTDWLVAYTQVINVAGADTFCESLEDINPMMNKIEESFKNLAQAANQVLFKHVINIKAAKKVLKIKYDAYREAAENYIEAALDASLIKDQDKQERARIGLLISYENQIKKIDAVAYKTLSNLKLQTPSISKYESIYKWRYQYSIYNLGVHSGVSVNKMKAHDDRVSQLKKNIDKMSKEISAGEKMINSKNPDYLYFSDEEQDKYDRVLQDREDKRRQKEAIKLRKAAEKEEKRQSKEDRKAEREQAKIDRIQRQADLADAEADAIEKKERRAQARAEAMKGRLKRDAGRKRKREGKGSLWNKLKNAAK